MSRRHTVFLGIVLTISCAVLAAISHIIPIGHGLDELAHLDHSFFRFAKPELPVNVEEGLIKPGRAPLDQGHQPPAFYYFNAAILSLFLKPEEIGAFFDYQAGILFSSAGGLLGGTSQCSFRLDTSRSDIEVRRFRRAIAALRWGNIVLLLVGTLCTFFAVRFMYPVRFDIPYAAFLFHLGIPTAIGRSAVVNNDNLVSTLCSMVFLGGVYYLTRTSGRGYRFLSALAGIAALTMLTKYNGILALGIIFLAIFLKQRTTFFQKFFSLTLVLGIFSMLLVPDLLHNMNVDGDLFSKAVVAHSNSHLYSPSSIWKIFQDFDFTYTVLFRFFIDYVSFPQRTPFLIHVSAFSWFILLAVSLLGILVGRVMSRVFFYVLGPVFGAWCIIFYIGATFPLADGRYIHTAITPISILVAVGVAQFCHILFKDINWARKFLFAVFGAVYLCGNLAAISTFIFYRYISCRTSNDFTVDAGGYIQTGDLDLDGQDELVLYHRVRARAFLARQVENSFELVPEWARHLGAAADELFLGDVNADGVSDPVFWRPSTGQWSYYDGKDILRHNKKLSLYSDLSRTPEPFVAKQIATIPAVIGDQPLMADLNADGAVEFIVYRPTGHWFIRFGTPGKLTTELYPPVTTHDVEEKAATAFLYRIANKVFLGTYKTTTGEVTIRDYHNVKRVWRFTLPPSKQILTSDVDGSGQDEIITWSDGPCITAYRIFMELSDSTAAVQGSTELCPTEEKLPMNFDRHHQLIRFITGKGKPEKLLLFNKRTAIVTILNIETNKSGNFQVAEVSEFDPGLLGTGFRKAQFKSSEK